MASEREFIKTRFDIVTQRLNDPNANIERQNRIQLQREHRLLGKLLDEVKEGHILETLEKWRSHFGVVLMQHKKDHQTQQRKYDTWCQMPYDLRVKTPEPPRPSLGVTITDKNGYTWVIDDRFLITVDDITKRLKMWLETDKS